MRQIILAIDTSTRTVGLALYDGIQVLSESVWTSKDFHTVELAPAVSDLLAKSNLDTSKLGAVAVSIGPGSFTGLRIGLAFAKGIALAQRLSLVGIPTLDALAAAQPVRDVPMAAVLHAGRGRLAVCWYKAHNQSWKPTQQIEVMTPKELSGRIRKPTMICGELTEQEQRIIRRKHKNALLASPARSLRRPAFLAELGWQRWQAGDVDDPASLAPVYLHHSEPIPG